MQLIELEHYPDSRSGGKDHAEYGMDEWLCLAEHTNIELDTARNLGELIETMFGAQVTILHYAGVDKGQHIGIGHIGIKRGERDTAFHRLEERVDLLREALDRIKRDARESLRDDDFYAGATSTR